MATLVKRFRYADETLVKNGLKYNKSSFFYLQFAKTIRNVRFKANLPKKCSQKDNRYQNHNGKFRTSQTVYV